MWGWISRKKKCNDQCGCLPLNAHSIIFTLHLGWIPLLRSFASASASAAGCSRLLFGPMRMLNDWALARESSSASELASEGRLDIVLYTVSSFLIRTRSSSNVVSVMSKHFFKLCLFYWELDLEVSYCVLMNSLAYLRLDYQYSTVCTGIYCAVQSVPCLLNHPQIEFSLNEFTQP